MRTNGVWTAGYELATTPLVMFKFDQLPVELAQAIMRTAAEDSLYVDRDWLVRLATVSRAVYWVVHPVLYRIMVITDLNVTAVSELAKDTRNHHIFGAVRRLHILRRLDIDDLPAPSLFTAPGFHIDAHIDVIESFITSMGPRISSIRAVNTRIQTIRFPPITHLAIDMRTVLTLSAEDWVCNLLAPLPSLTHVAFEFVDESFITRKEGVVQYLQLIPAMLAYTRSRNIQFSARFAGSYVVYWRRTWALRSTWSDPHFEVWVDERPAERRFDQDRHFRRDAWEGRDAWTGTRPAPSLA